MKEKIINRLKKEQDKKAFLFTFYPDYFRLQNGERQQKSKEIWQKIKENKKEIIPIIDVIILLLNDDCFQGEELRLFVDYIKGHDHLQKALSHIYNDSAEGIWEEADFNEVINQPEDAQQINQRVIDEQNKAISLLKNWLYKGRQFISLMIRNCPNFFQNLSDECLKKLITENTAAISLLLISKVDKRFAELLTHDDIVNLILADTPQVEQKVHTLIILDYCANYQQESLWFILHHLNSPDISVEKKRLKNPPELKQRLLHCENALLTFLEKNPNFFEPLVQRVDILFEILAFTPTPIAFLSQMAKSKIEIANWISAHALEIVSFLLKEGTHKRSKEISQFLLKHNACIHNKKIALSTRLSEEVKDMINNIANNDAYSALELNALFTLLDDSEIRRVIALGDEELFKLLDDPFFKPIVDQIIAKDLILWGNFKPTQHSNARRSTVFSQYPFINARFTLEINEAQENLNTYSAGAMDAVCAFLIANGEKWPNVKQKIENALDKHTFHPFFICRLEYDGSKSRKHFKEFLLEYLLYGKGFSLLKADRFYIDLFIALASGNHYIALMKRFAETEESLTQNNKESFTDNLQNYFVLKIIETPYLLKKLAAALGSSNLYLFTEHLDKKELVSCISCDIWLNSVLSVEEDLREAMLEMTAANFLLLKKLYLYTSINPDFSLKMVKLFTLPKSVEILFCNFKKSQYAEFINYFSFDIIKFLSQLENYPLIKDAIIEELTTALDTIKNQDVVVYVLQHDKFAKKVFVHFSYEKFVQLLRSKPIGESRESVLQILKLRDHFPFHELIKNLEDVLSIIRENKYFAAFVFKSKFLLRDMRLSPELLLRIVIEPKYADVLKYLSKRSDTYFFPVLRNLLEALPVTLQAKIKNSENKEIPKLLELTLKLEPPRVRYRKIEGPSDVGDVDAKDLENKIKSEKFLAENGGLGTNYKGLSGVKASKLKIVHLQCVNNYMEGIRDLISNINQEYFLPSLENTPVTFLLNDDFYSFLLNEKLEGSLSSNGKLGLELKPKQATEAVYSFIKSLPDELFYLSNYFDLSNQNHQLAFLQIHFRIRQIVMKLLGTYGEQLRVDFNKKIAEEFLSCLYFATTNFNFDVLQFLSNKEMYRITFKCLYENDTADFYQCETAGEMFSRLLMLKAAFVFDAKPEEKQIIINELYTQPMQLCTKNIRLILNLFPSKFLRNSKNPQLIGYFLRQPLYVEHMNEKRIKLLIGNFPELIECAFIYPNLYRKFSSETVREFIKSGSKVFNISDKEINNYLSSSALTEAILSEHEFFTKEEKHEEKMNGTTSKLFKTMKVESSSNKNSKEPVEHNLDELLEFFRKNPYLSFLNHETIFPFFEAVLKTHPTLSKFELTERLVMLAMENRKGHMEEETKALFSLAGKQLPTGLNEKVVNLWKKDFPIGMIKQEMDKLITNEVSQIAGFKLKVTLSPSVSEKPKALVK